MTGQLGWVVCDGRIGRQGGVCGDSQICRWLSHPNEIVWRALWKREWQACIKLASSKYRIGVQLTSSRALHVSPEAFVASFDAFVTDPSYASFSPTWVEWPSRRGFALTAHGLALIFGTASLTFIVCGKGDRKKSHTGEDNSVRELHLRCGNRIRRVFWISFCFREG